MTSLHPGQPSAALWRVGDWTEFRTLQAINSWSFSRDGRRLALAAADGVWRAALPQGHGGRLGQGGPRRSGRSTGPANIALSPDGSMLATAREFAHRVRPLGRQPQGRSSAPTGATPPASMRSTSPRTARGSPLARGTTRSGSGTRNPTRSPTGRRTFAPIQSYASDAAIRPDGQQMAFVQGDNVAGFFNPAGRDGDAVRSVGRQGREDDRAVPTRAVPAGSPTRPTAATLASGGRDGKVRVWDATTGEPIGSFSGHERLDRGPGRQPRRPLGGLVARADGDTRGAERPQASPRPVAGRRGQGLGREDGRGPADDSTCRALAAKAVFSPDGGSLVDFSTAAAVKLWDLATGERRWEAPIGNAFSPGLAFSPDGSILAVAGRRRRRPARCADRPRAVPPDGLRRGASSAAWPSAPTAAGSRPPYRAR